MKHDLPPLDTLKVFEASARHLSFSLAADELCLSKGAVSYQIQKLEGSLSCALFRRTTRQVYLTEDGQELLKTTQGVFNELRHQFAQFTNNNEDQQVSIAVTTYVAVRWLSANMAGFIEKHPDVSIVLHHSVNSSSFNLSDVDMALRWSPCRKRKEANRLAEAALPMFPVCSPKLLKRMGHSPQTVMTQEMILQKPWCNIPLLCEDRSEDFWDEWSKTLPEKLANPRRVINDSNVRVQAAIDGQGWMLADELMRNELNNDWLVNPLKDCLTGYGYALLRNPSRVVNPKAQLLGEWLSEKLNHTNEHLQYPS